MDHTVGARRLGQVRIGIKGSARYQDHDIAVTRACEHVADTAGIASGGQHLSTHDDDARTGLLDLFEELSRPHVDSQVEHAIPGFFQGGGNHVLAHRVMVLVHASYEHRDAGVRVR